MLFLIWETKESSLRNCWKFSLFGDYVNFEKLEAIARETQESPRNHQSQNSAALGITEDYKAQVSEDTEGRVTKIISQEISRTKSRILDALTKLD